MTVLAIRRTTVNALSVKQRRLLRAVAERLDLGDPADYTAGTTRWLVWDDDRIDLRDLAALGTLAGRFAEAETAVAESDESPRKALREWVSTNWKLDQPPEGTANPFQWVLTNNGAPAAVQAANGIPAGWVPTTA